MNAPRLVIIDGVRTPFSKMGTDLARLGPEELGRIAVNALLTRTGLNPALIDEVIFGCVGQPADAANVARVIALRAGIPEHVPAFTVHRNCASGCEAFTQAYEKMLAGRGEIFVVGGAESMSQVPLFYTHQAAAIDHALDGRNVVITTPTASGKEHQSLYSYDNLHRLIGITHQLCTTSTGTVAALRRRPAVRSS